MASNAKQDEAGCKTSTDNGRQASLRVFSSVRDCTNASQHDLQAKLTETDEQAVQFFFVSKLCIQI